MATLVLNGASRRIAALASVPMMSSKPSFRTYLCRISSCYKRRFRKVEESATLVRWI